MADYYSFKKNNVNDTRYVPGKFGTALIWITMPAVLVAMISVFVALFAKGDVRFIAFVVTGVAFIIAFIGSILMAVDVVRHNRRVAKQNQKSEEKGPKQMDIGRIAHLAVGIIIGIVVAFLLFKIMS